MISLTPHGGGVLNLGLDSITVRGDAVDLTSEEMESRSRILKAAYFTIAY